MSSTDSKIQKIQGQFQALSAVASSLNAASDELTQVVGILDEALRKLNLGLVVWETFTDWGDEEDPMRYDCEQIGYAKVNSRWGVALRHIWGHEAYESHNEEGPWLFSDAPREMRVRSVGKIAGLIESLSKRASETTKKVQEKTKEVRELASAIASIANESKGKLPTMAEPVAVGQQALSGKLSDLAGTKEGSK